jgi:valyl-tRNA synthetase
MNVEEEIVKLEALLVYTIAFLKSVQNKLADEKFVTCAPEKVLLTKFKKKQIL